MARLDQVDQVDHVDHILDLCHLHENVCYSLFVGCRRLCEVGVGNFSAREIVGWFTCNSRYVCPLKCVDRGLPA